ncbi:hypothetical protein F4808DRAFT_84987 [Astrocystis sublimbata]|nr:hypothetical protein F4808DRAFT_84987 [Astrocystis sublimbata]
MYMACQYPYLCRLLQCTCMRFFSSALRCWSWILFPLLVHKPPLPVPCFPFPLLLTSGCRVSLCLLFYLSCLSCFRHIIHRLIYARSATYARYFRYFPSTHRHPVLSVLLCWKGSVITCRASKEPRFVTLQLQLQLL